MSSHSTPATVPTLSLPESRIQTSRLALTIQGVQIDVAVLQRSTDNGEHGANSASQNGSNKAPIVFLHGFGSTKEDYADIVFHSAFDGQAIIAFDAPGCGETRCSLPHTSPAQTDTTEALSHINIPFLVETALGVLDALEVDTFHLVGHSMGGLTALMLAHHNPERVMSFVDIEGNIAPEDCFLSRQIISHDHADPQQFFAEFVERTRQTPAFSSALYAASLQHKVRAGAVRGIFESMVDLSDNAALMDKFLNLPCPTMFMYGEQNTSLSYLTHIQAQGVQLAEIPCCGHFPMYSNPTAMWAAIAAFYSANLSSQ